MPRDGNHPNISRTPTRAGRGSGDTRVSWQLYVLAALAVAGLAYVLVWWTAEPPPRPAAELPDDPGLAEEIDRRRARHISGLLHAENSAARRRDAYRLRRRDAEE